MKRIKINEVDSNLFYQVPKEFFSNPKYLGLSSDSILLYSMLKDRMRLSKKNNWVNDEGEIFLIFTRKELSELMRKCETTVTKAFKQLDKFHLIDDVRRGVNKPNLIFICHLELQSIENTRNGKKYRSRTVKSTGQEQKNLQPSNNDLNKTDLNEIDKTTTVKKPKTPKKKKIVVVDTSLIDILYKDIKDTIKVSVTKKRIQELLTNFGEQEIRKYISNWESFKDIDKKTVSGYFVDAVKNSYDIPVKEVKQHNKSDYGKHTEFEQRTYSDGFYESLYENSDVKTG